MNTKIWPSIVAKDQKELDFFYKKMKGVTKTLHLDIVDGKFAPNHSLNFNFKLSKEFDYVAHLMVKEPENWIKKNLPKYDGKKNGKINLVIPHFEAFKNVEKYIKETKQRKQKVAFAILPETKIKTIKKYLHDLDYILVLTVHPGFYGSKYLVRNWKIRKIKKINPNIKIIDDGGMTPKTIKQASKAGADYFISGSFVTKSDNPKEQIKKLKKSLS
ncbi:MAG: hypothetical protein ABIH82_02715 [Candidatus Woesearchaeota archaeon]